MGIKRCKFAEKVLIIRKQCPNEVVPKEEAKYCQLHGCCFCEYKNRATTTVGDVTNKKGCCRGCKEETERKFAAAQEENKIRNLCYKVDDEANDLTTKLKIIYLPFYENIKQIKEHLDELKKKIFKKEVVVNSNQYSVLITNIIHQYSTLPENEKTEWKKIYENASLESDELINLLLPEQNFLISLAEKYKQLQEQTEREQIIQEIKTELNTLPTVNIVELDNKYNNYDSLDLSQLKNSKGDIIAAIKNKRVEKKLTNLLKRANNCSDNDLWNFIQELKKFISAPTSSYQKNSYLACQNEVDAALNKLRNRWNNLSEEAKLTNFWNKTIQNFDNWLQEAENLQLATDDPFANFKEEIKKIKSLEAIEAREKEAYQHILTKFKEAVKESFGAEQQSDEYREIDNSQNFEEVKLARNNIKQRRQNSNFPTPPTPPNNDSPPSPSPSKKPEHDKKKDGSKSRSPKNSLNHSNKLTNKIVIGATTIIGGVVIIVLIGIIAKNWKRIREREREREREN